MSDQLSFLDATACAELIRSGETSALELVDAAIARIEKLNPELNAIITSRFEEARQDARGELPDGPFRGVPFVLKDLDIIAAGEPFHGGMAFLKQANYVPARSSYLAEKYRAAGLISLGKTNTPELGLNVTTEPWSYGPSRNPWNPEHSTGGSSGGSGAAVASGMVPVAHTGDGGGSIRVPASECGLVGLKPSRGRISLGPEYGEYWSGFVTPHVVSRSVRDSAALLDVSAGAMPGDPYTAPPPERAFASVLSTDPRPLRIGLMTRAPEGGSPCAPECSAAVESAGRLLESLGHHVDLAHPPALDQHSRMLEGFSTIVSCWVSKALRFWEETVGREIGPQDVESNTWLMAEQGGNTSAADFLATLEDLHDWSRSVLGWWADGYDLLVTPTIAAPPPRIGELVASAEDPASSLARAFSLVPFTPQFNVTGQPAISLPLAWSRAGLPIGVQLVGDAYREDLLLSMAAQLERAEPWSGRRPPLWA